MVRQTNQMRSKPASAPSAKGKSWFSNLWFWNNKTSSKTSGHIGGKTMKKSGQKPAVFYRCRETTCKGLMCARKVKVYGTYCWQHPRELMQSRKQFTMTASVSTAMSVKKAQNKMMKPVELLRAKSIKKKVVKKPVTKPMKKSIKKSIKKSVRRSTKKSAKKKSKKPVKKLVKRSFKKSAKKSVKKAMKRRPRNNFSKMTRDSALEFFNFMDKNNDGEISKDEFKRAWKVNMIPVY